MEGFFRIPGIIKRLMIEAVAVFFFPLFLLGVVNELGPGAFSGHYDIDGAEWLYALTGPVFMAWVVYEIFWPKVKQEKWKLHIGSFKICSSHPSYVLMDGIVIGLVIAYVALGLSAGATQTAFWLTLATAIGVPTVRLVAWYLLGFRIDDLETVNAHQPVVWVAGIFLFLAALVAVLVKFN